MTNKITILRLLYLSIVLVMLSSCTPTANINPPTTAVVTATSANDNNDNNLTATLTSLLEHARRSLTPQAQRDYLEASRLLITLDRKEEALKLISSLNTATLEQTLAADILLQKALLQLEYSQAAAALTTLKQPQLSPFSKLSNSQELIYHSLKAQAHLKQSQFLESAQSRIFLDRVLPSREKAQNHELLWSALTSAPQYELLLMSATETNADFQGWYELASLSKELQFNLERQLSEIKSWQRRWPRHPASNPLPQALQAIESIVKNRPTKVAVLLPLNTSSGTVVRDGFMSALFHAQQNGSTIPSIHFYDTSSALDIAGLHQQAVNEGAELIIGPLLKQNVAQLQKRSSLQVPTLALNNIEGIHTNSNLLYQFSLSPENEARQIALKAWADGHKNVAVLSPRDNAGNDFYIRKRNSFTQTWQDLGGTIVAQEIFQDNFTDVIETLLDLSESEFRMEQLSDLIGKSLEFTQRRRQDVDFIFLIAQPNDARQINPRLSYLYAGDIPVYASQDIYQGSARPLEDSDLNGIQFSDSPWLLSNNDELKKQTQELFPQSSASMLRLQAFGIDIFRLYPRLKQLEIIPDSHILGATGELKLGDNRTIVRELGWAKIENGLATLLQQSE